MESGGPLGRSILRLDRPPSARQDIFAARREVTLESEARMNRKTAAISFLTVCLILSVLLVTGTVSGTVSGFVFAAALVGFGLASRGFRGAA